MPKSRSVAELKLNVELIGGEWSVQGGSTFKYRVQLKKAGGKWDKPLSCWVFGEDPSRLIDELNNEIQEEADRIHRQRQEQGRKLSLAKATLAEKRKQKAEEKEKWELLWNDPVSKQEIDDITKKIVDQRATDGFWPLNENSPFCMCGIHVFWTLYNKADKNIEKAAQSYHMFCPGCHFDYTK